MDEEEWVVVTRVVGAGEEEPWFGRVARVLAVVVDDDGTGLEEATVDGVEVVCDSIDWGVVCFLCL